MTLKIQGAAIDGERREALLVLLERAGVAVLLLAAVFFRGRDLSAGFDRHVVGGQGAGNLLCALNYERLGLLRIDGYPAINVQTFVDRPETWNVYANHPPLVPLLVYGSARAFGPDGWEDQLARGSAPDGLEGAIRVPFLALHMLGLFAFFWALRPAVGRTESLVALAVLAVLPLSALFGTLVNHETPSLTFELFGYGFFVRWLLAESPAKKRLALLGVGASFFAAGCVTYFPVLFAVPLVLHRILARRLSESVVIGIASAGAALVPLFAHSRLRAGALAALGLEQQAMADRATNILPPFFGGPSVNEGGVAVADWARTQFEVLLRYTTWPVLTVALVGLVIALARAGSGARVRDGARRVEVPLLLFLSGALVQTVFYRHTADPQENFIVNSGPAVAALVAVVIAGLAKPLYRLRGGIAPLVLLTSTLLLPCLWRDAELGTYWRAPGPEDVPAGTEGPSVPLPKTSGESIAEVLPADACGLYPAAMGFSFATFYYAQRTLHPVSSPGDVAIAMKYFEVLGFEDAPVVLLIPKDPAPASADGVRAVWELFREMQPVLAEAPPAFESEEWRGYLILP